jgi:hypothetical protein
MKVFLRTALCGVATIMTVAGYSVQVLAAPQDQTAPTTLTPERNTPSQQTTASAASSFAIEQLLQHVSRAQLLIHLGDKAGASDHIQQALAITRNLESSAPEQRTRTNVRTGIVSYLTGKNRNDYIVPLLDNVEVIKTYTTGPFWSDKKGLAVKDVRAVNATIAIDPAQAAKRLQKASEYIAKDKFEDTSDELVKFQKSIVVEEKAVHLPLQQAREDLMLAQFMVQRNFFEGSRFALKHADDALDNVKPATDERKERVKAMRNEIKQLEKTLAQKDPTITDNAMAQIKKWGDELNTWANDTMS